MNLIRNRRLAVFATSMLLVFGLAATDLAVTGCGNNGGGGTSGTGSSVDPGDGSDFSGAYALRDTDCDPFDGLLEFDVEQTGMDLVVTVTRAEGDVYFEGDVFDGTVLEGDGVFAAGVQELSCISQLVLKQEDIDIVKGISDVDVQIGDLDAFCNDESADHFCFSIYRHAGF